FHSVKFGAPEPIESDSQSAQLMLANSPSFTTSPSIYTAHRPGAIVKAICTQSAEELISAAAPPSNQLSLVPVPTFNFIRWCPGSPGSRNNRKPLLRLLFEASGGLTVRIPPFWGVLFILYQNEALNSLPTRPSVGTVRCLSVASAFARRHFPAAKPGLPTRVALILPTRSR